MAVHGARLLIAQAYGVHFFERVDDIWTEVMQVPLMATSLAIDEDIALVGTGSRLGGAVHVFHRREDQWDKASELRGDRPGFGRAVSLDGEMALIGSRGSVQFFRLIDNVLTSEAEITGSALGMEADSDFGGIVHLSGGRAVVGTPRDQQFSGSVQVFRNDSGTWQLDKTLHPQRVGSRGLFGASVQLIPEGLWVGAPGEDQAYLFQSDGAERHIAASEQGAATSWGGALAAGDGVLLLGMPRVDYGEGIARLFVKEGDQWARAQELFNPLPGMDAITGEGARCDAGAAADFVCDQVDLVSFLPLADMYTNRGVRLNDVWGWTDPETGKEYGLVGHLEGTAFVDVSDPSMPVFLGELPRTEGSPGSTWRDMKVYQNHAFIVADGAGAHGMQIFDLTRLRSVSDVPALFDADVHYAEIHSAHNIVINEETGFAFVVGASGGGNTCGGGLHMINIQEPQSPEFVGCFADESTGRAQTGYSHDAQCVIYHGPDVTYQGREICIGSNETAISIADITDKENPVTISSGSYPDAAYVHQGWLSEDHTFFYQNDELDEISQQVDRTRTLVWDVRDLDDPLLVKEYFGPTSATDHNLYVRGDLMYQTNNANGLRILDITDRAEPREVGFFDTTPYGVDESGFNGTWSSYPYFESGIILVTSRREGLFILRKQSVGS